MYKARFWYKNNFSEFKNDQNTRLIQVRVPILFRKQWVNERIACPFLNNTAGNRIIQRRRSEKFENQEKTWKECYQFRKATLKSMGNVEWTSDEKICEVWVNVVLSVNCKEIGLNSCRFLVRLSSFSCVGKALMSAQISASFEATLLMWAESCERNSSRIDNFTL